MSVTIIGLDGKKTTRPYTEKELADNARAVEEDNALFDAQPHGDKRLLEFHNGDYIDAIMKEMNARRANGEKLTPDMAAALDHWLAVKEKYPKAESVKNDNR